jgi:uncharacterized protein YutE (UPF0331/DUF86 family)
VTDAQLVLRKLSVLRDHLRRARRRRPDAIEALRDDDDRQDALAMSILVIVQEAVDIAFHIVTDDGVGVPASNAEAFELLAKHGVIEGALAGRLAQAAGLRNRLAHGYASVDVERLWSELPAGLDAIERFTVDVAAFIGRSG